MRERSEGPRGGSRAPRAVGVREGRRRCGSRWSEPAKEAAGARVSGRRKELGGGAALWAAGALRGPRTAEAVMWARLATWRATVGAAAMSGGGSDVSGGGG